jgi:hypothetical protein
VHSLRKSPDARHLSPQPPNSPPAPYARLFYHGGLYEGESRTNSLGYESVVEVVEGVAGAEEIQGAKDL